MSQEQAKFLCEQARKAIDAAIGQGWALAAPTASATLSTASIYLSGASNELGGDANLASLAGEVAGKAAEILGIMAIPWPFVYAGIGAWANGLSIIKSKIPAIVVLQPAGMRTPGLAPSYAAPNAFTVPSVPDIGMAYVPSLATALHAGKGPKGYRRSDSRIREDVCEALSIDPLVDASDIEVVVSEGRVKLAGRVDNRAASRRAEDVALAVAGVSDVENAMKTTEVSEEPLRPRAAG